jgi:hypothetical protein
MTDTDTTRRTDRAGLAITVDDVEALVLYDDAVDEFVAGRPCRSLAETCVERAPTFALARACAALAESEDTGRLPVQGNGWPPPTSGLTRRERQHLEIVGAVLMGRLDRASGLAAEHLTEYPTDRLIASLRTTAMGLRIRGDDTID